MGKSSSLESLKTSYKNFMSASESVLKTMPDYISKFVSDELKPNFENLISISADRALAGLDKGSAIDTKRELVTAIDKTLENIWHYLKATTNDKIVKEYFPVTLSARTKDMDRPVAVDTLLNVSGHYSDAHIKDYKAQLESLKKSCAEVFSKSSLAKSEAKGEVKKLNDTREICERKYQKTRLLFKAYFYDTNIDYTRFFDDPMNNSGKSDEKENEQPILKPVKPIDRIRTGTVVVPPPVIAPEKKIP